MTHWTKAELAEHLRQKQTPAERTAAAARETTADRQAEKELQGQCEARLRRDGIEFLHLSPRAREKKGWPDLTFALRMPTSCKTCFVHYHEPRPVAVELKTATGRISEDQKRTLGRMAGNGWQVRVARDYDTFCAILAGDLTAGEQIEEGTTP